MRQASQRVPDSAQRTVRDIRRATRRLGRTLHEVFRIREVQDHRTDGTVVALNPPRHWLQSGIPRSTFYDWYSRYQEGGIEAVEDGHKAALRAREGPRALRKAPPSSRMRRRRHRSRAPQ